MPNCPACGTPSTDPAARFCGRCATPLPPAEPGVPPAAAEAARAGLPERPTAGPEPAPAPTESNGGARQPEPVNREAEPAPALVVPPVVAPASPEVPPVVVPVVAPASASVVPPVGPAKPPVVSGASPEVAPASAPGGGTPPPPAYAPAVGGNRDVGGFARRVLLGRWEGAAVAVAGPVALLLVTAGVLGAAAGGGSLGLGGAGWWTRSRGALALLVLGLGGHLRVGESLSGLDNNGGDPSSGAYGSTMTVTGGTTNSTLALLPLTVTLVTLATLVVGLRAMRRRQTGPEAAVRVAVLGAVAGAVLALTGQLSVGRVHVHTSFGLVAVWTFLVCLVTALAVLHGPGRAAWLAARPQLVTAWRVLRTALLALAATVLFAGVVVLLVALAHYDRLGGWTMVGALFLLPNLGVSGLGLGWGAPVDASSGAGGGDAFHFSYSLSDLSRVADGWAAIGAVAGGLLCALLIGALAARHHRVRAEQFGVAAVFTVLFVVLAALGGLVTDSPLGSASGMHSEIGTGVATALLVSLLWSFGGVALGPYAARALNGVLPYPEQGAYPAQGRYAQGRYRQGAYVARPPYAPPPRPGTAPLPPQAPPEPTVHDLGIVQPDRLGKRPPEHG